MTSYVPSPLSRTSGVNVPDKQNMFQLALSNNPDRDGMLITDDRSRHNFQNTASLIRELETIDNKSVQCHIFLQLTIKSPGM